jgi:signal transduction histidine kinase
MAHQGKKMMARPAPGGAPRGCGGRDETWAAALHRADHQRLEDEFRCTVVERVALDTAFRVVWPDGSVHAQWARTRVVRGEDGTPRRLGGGARDATESGRLKQDAQEALRVRDEFLSTVAHDLKNSLATIKGNVQLLQQRATRARGLTSEWQLSVLSDIDAAATQMAQYLDHLLAAARAQAGQPPELERRPTDLVALGRRVAAKHQQGTQRHQIQVRAAVPEVVGPWDAARLERLLDNLLGNAVKYSPAGGAVTVSVTCEDDAAGRWAVVTVHDQGLGIPPADLPRLFECFYRGSNMADRICGSGIGLTSARQIVELHGGTITVQSKEGIGSTFTVRLPLTVPDTVGDPATAAR